MRPRPSACSRLYPTCGGVAQVGSLRGSRSGPPEGPGRGRAEEFAASYPILWPGISRLGITSAAYMPLIAQARPIGALGLLY
ncbi:hypothetical protein, partial [Streptomyces sp. AS13]|uniref:hypothetical protein n=1 Tax=Streptomyces sp. AS13 TaxID=3038080 RepID=UPI00278C83C6